MAEVTKSEPKFAIRKPLDGLDRLKMLFYGNLGTGKTRLIGSGFEDSDFDPILLIAPDPGDLSLGVEGFNVDVAPITHLDDLDDIYEYLSSPANKYKTCALDGLTDLAEIAMAGIMRRTVEEQPDRDPDLPGIDQHGKNAFKLRKIIRLFRDLPMHFICTTLEKEVKDEASGKLFLRPSLPGKLANEAGAYFDIVGRMTTRFVEAEKGKGDRVIERVLQVQPTDRVIAKDRTRRLGFEVVNPTLGSMMHTIRTNAALTPAPAGEPTIKTKTVDVGKKR